jgi:UDP-N-acetylmuramate dehydrogenase
LLPDERFAAARFVFPQKGNEREAQQAIKACLAERKQKQPIGRFSCGSVFINPPNDSAGRLIEACGLKGMSQGDAQISTKHANFIINTTGLAKASEIHGLILLAQKRVFEHCGIKLKPEVMICDPKS